MFRCLKNHNTSSAYLAPDFKILNLNLNLNLRNKNVLFFHQEKQIHTNQAKPQDPKKLIQKQRANEKMRKFPDYQTPTFSKKIQDYQTKP